MQKKVINVLLLTFRLTTNAKEWCEGNFTAPGHGGLKIRKLSIYIVQMWQLLKVLGYY